MSLTEIQKEQIRYMVSQNPTIENMSRVASLTDENVLSELEQFKANKLPILEQEKQQVEQETDSYSIRLTNINKLIELLEQ